MNLSQLLLFQCLIAQVVHHSVASSAHTPNAQFSMRHSKENNGTECPSVWYKYNLATEDCQCISFVSLTCDGEYAHVSNHHTLTYNANKRVITEIKMRHKTVTGYNTTNGGYYILLPNNISELNQYMCDPLNRKDYMCRRCKNGYGPAVTYQSSSCASMCYLCKDTWRDLLLYLSVKFISLTVFYLLMLVFQIRLTSAPMTCFIMYSQLVVLAFYEECGVKPGNSLVSQIKFDAEGTLRTGTKILLTIYGMFNLDFFHYVLPPLCISSHLRPIHVFSLGYISAFYPFILILLTWLCVELHGRNFRPIVCLWRPFHGCFVRLRRGWNTKSDLIDVFASFFLLSYSRIIYQIMLTFDFVEITNYSLIDGLKSFDYVLKADFSIVVFNSTSYIYYPYIVVACFTAILGLLFIIFPMLVLFFYPTKMSQRLLSAKCIHNRLRIFLYTFIEKYHCCYRDGLDGAKDMRSFSGIYFLLRITLYISETVSWEIFNIHAPFAYGFVLSVTALLIALSRPYKKTYINVVDSILLSHIATFCYIWGCVRNTPDRSHLFLSLMQTILFLPFLVVFLFTTYRLSCKILQLFWGSLSRCLTFAKNTRAKFYDSFTPQTKTATTYGAINY